MDGRDARVPLGDVLRIFAGDFTAGEIAGKPAGQGTWLLIGVIMLVPIAMSLLVSYPAIGWLSTVAALASIAFNLVGLPYKGMYDNFLIVVSFVFCGLIAWYAWTW